MIWLILSDIYSRYVWNKYCITTKYLLYSVTATDKTIYKNSKLHQQEIQVSSHHSTPLPTLFDWQVIFGVQHRHTRRLELSTKHKHSWHDIWTYYLKLLICSKGYFVSTFIMLLFIFSFSHVRLCVRVRECICETSCHPFFIDLAMGVLEDRVKES